MSGPAPREQGPALWWRETGRRVRRLMGRKSYVPFIVLARSRVGSNLLRSLLNAHPCMVAYGEIFRDRTSADWDHTGEFESPRERALARADPVRFLDRKVFGRYPGCVEAVGFKLFYYHARDGADAAVWPYLRDRTDIRIIHLRRRNLLRTHLSRKLAGITDRWVDTSGQPGAPAVVTLDYDECVNDFLQTRAWEEEADRYFSGHAMLAIDYEALARSYEAEARRVQQFLGVTPHPASPTTFPQARQPLSESIANYASLKARFAGTEWAPFFTE